MWFKEEDMGESARNLKIYVKTDARSAKKKEQNAGNFKISSVRHI